MVGESMIVYSDSVYEGLKGGVWQFRQWHV